MDLSTKTSTRSKRQWRPHKTKVVELPHERTRLPLKSAYDRAIYTLERLKRGTPPSALDNPSTDDVGEATVRVIPAGDRWAQLGKHWMRIHTLPRSTAYSPQLEDGGPDVSALNGIRITCKSFARGHVDTINDDWRTAASDSNSYHWTDATTRLTEDPPADQDVR